MNAMKHSLQVALDEYLTFWKESGLDALDPTFSKQRGCAQTMNSFAHQYPDCFKRTCLPGHFTTSAFVVAPCGNQVLLTYHAKLQRWLQLGGHIEGEDAMHKSAAREVEEESGIHAIEFLMRSSTGIPIPFDIDIHPVGHSLETHHLHYDIRYAIRTLERGLTISEESLDLKWVDRKELPLYTQEDSILRMNAKFELLNKIVLLK